MGHYSKIWGKWGLFSDKIPIWVYCRGSKFHFKCEKGTGNQFGVAINLKPFSVLPGIILLKKSQKTDCNCLQIEYIHQFSKYVK